MPVSEVPQKPWARGNESDEQPMCFVGFIAGCLLLFRRKRRHTWSGGWLLISGNRIGVEVIESAAEGERRDHRPDRVALCVGIRGRMTLQPCRQMLLFKLGHLQSTAVATQVVQSFLHHLCRSRVWLTGADRSDRRRTLALQSGFSERPLWTV